MPKAKSYIGIKNEAGSDTLELHFTDYIYDGFDWNTWEYKNLVQDTINKIKAANPDKITIVINSLGGDVMIGMALYNYLKNHKAEKTVQIIGFAASIASVMAMCASPGKLTMAKNAFMIIHAAWSGAVGNAKEMREQAAVLDKITDELADIYAQRSGKEAKYFTKMWKDGDVWLSGTEAREEGLVDELFNAEPVSAGLDFTAHNFLHNIPETLRPAAAAGDPAPGQNNFFTKLNDSFMGFLDKLKAAVSGAKADDKYNDVPGREKVLDMVEEVFKPFAQMVDKAEATENKPADEAKPAAAPAEDAKPAEVKPEASKPAAENKPSAEAEELEKLREENKKLKAAAAAKNAKPAPAPGGDDDDGDELDEKTKKARARNARLLKTANVIFDKDGDDGDDD